MDWNSFPGLHTEQLDSVFHVTMPGRNSFPGLHTEKLDSVLRHQMLGRPSDAPQHAAAVCGLGTRQQPLCTGALWEPEGDLGNQ